MSGNDIRCAGCDRYPCVCLSRGGIEARELLERAARGEDVHAAALAWLERQRQRAQQFEDEQAEFHRAADALRRRAGGSLGPVSALRFLLGADLTDTYSARGADADVHTKMRLRGESARLEHVAWARAWIANRWLRADGEPGRRRWRRHLRRARERLHARQGELCR
jgi:hypothetical protein